MVCSHSVLPPPSARSQSTQPGIRALLSASNNEGCSVLAATTLPSLRARLLAAARDGRSKSPGPRPSSAASAAATAPAASSRRLRSPAPLLTQ